MTNIFLFTNVTENQANWNDIESKIPITQRRRISTIGNPRLKHKKTIATLLLLNILQSYTQLGINDIIINYTKYGKPYLPFSQSIHFNYSYSSHYILIGIDPNKPIGVDIESNAPLDFSIADRVLSDEEKKIFALEACDNKQMKFYEFWTKKEAYLKCIGCGIIFNLNKINTCSNQMSFLTQKEENYVFSVYPKPDKYLLNTISLKNINLENLSSLTEIYK